MDSVSKDGTNDSRNASAPQGADPSSLLPAGSDIASRAGDVLRALSILVPGVKLDLGLAQTDPAFVEAMYLVATMDADPERLSTRRPEIPLHTDLVKRGVPAWAQTLATHDVIEALTRHTRSFEVELPPGASPLG